MQPCNINAISQKSIFYQSFIHDLLLHDEGEGSIDKTSMRE
jgi:hypothetical protein